MTADLFAAAVAAHRTGRIEEAQRLYRRTLDADPRHAGALSNLATLHFMRGDVGPGLLLLDQALAADPNQPATFYNRGNVLLGLKRPAEALADYDAALRLKPDYPDALCNRGVALKDLERPDEAVEAYARALAVQPDHLAAAGNRAALLMDLRRIDEALAAYETLCVLTPGSAVAHFHRSDLLEMAGRSDEALAAVDRALALDPGYAEAHALKGCLLMLTGQQKAGWAELEWRWRTDWFAPQRREMHRPQWSMGMPVQGQSVMLYADQGLGDALQMLRYAPLLADMGATVLLCVHPTLVDLAWSVRGVAGVTELGKPLPPFDLHCPMMSLPYAFGTEADSVPAEVPYVRADPAKVAAWTERLPPDGRPRVGLAWSGYAGHKNDHNRSLALSTLSPLLALDARFVSLQVDYRDGDRALLTEPPIMDVWSSLADMGDTAALIETLDLVIAVDTSVAHLAGALGKPVWILLPHQPDYRWERVREDCPWYPSARLLRQPKAGDWAAVIEGARTRLAALIP